MKAILTYLLLVFLSIPIVFSQSLEVFPNPGTQADDIYVISDMYSGNIFHLQYTDVEHIGDTIFVEAYFKDSGLPEFWESIDTTFLGNGFDPGTYTVKFDRYRINNLSQTSYSSTYYTEFTIIDAYSYITVWNTNNFGMSNNDQITLPATGNFDYTWAEVSDPANTGSGSGSNTTTITFPAPGIYELRVLPNESNPFSRIEFDFDSNTDANKLMEIKQWGNVIWSSFHEAYAGTSNLTISATDIPNLSNVSDMSYAFYQSDIETVPNINIWDVSMNNWDVSNVTNMQSMFEGAYNFNQSLSNWKLSSLDVAENIFGNSNMDCINYSLTLQGWANNPNTASDVSMLSNFGLPEYSPDVVDDRDYLINTLGWEISGDNLGSCTLPAPSSYITVWNTQIAGISNNNQITFPATGDFDYTWFEVSDPVNNGSGSGSNTTTITFPSSGIYELHVLPTIINPFRRIEFDFNSNTDANKLIELKQWGNVAWSSFHAAYASTYNLTISATDIPNLSNLTDMSYAFYHSMIDTVPNMNNWNVGNITNMSSMFEGQYWWPDMSFNFNQPLNNWDVSNVTDMSSMFRSSSFNQPIGNWDVGNVTDMSEMFAGGYDSSEPDVYISVFNQPLNDWDVSNVTDMNLMFYRSSYNQPLNDWDVSNVKNMSGMFAGDSDGWAIVYSSPFNHPLNDWDVSGVTDMSSMFFGASYNQPLNDWDVSGVTDMSSMFEQASFNQPLNDWEVSSLDFAENIFGNSNMDCNNYSLTLQGWADNPNTASNVGMASYGLPSYSPDVIDDRDYLINTLGWDISGDELGDCSITVGVEQYNMSNISVYPNPTNDFAILVTQSGNGNYEVFDDSGRILLQGKITGIDTRVDVSTLAAGIYFLKVKAASTESTTKLVITAR